MLGVEDLWAGVGGSAGSGGLAELALEQKESNVELVEHHYYLAVIVAAVLTFSMKQCRPMSLFDTKVSLAVVTSSCDMRLKVWYVLV